MIIDSKPTIIQQNSNPKVTEKDNEQQQEKQEKDNEQNESNEP